VPGFEHSGIPYAGVSFKGENKSMGFVSKTEDDRDAIERGLRKQQEEQEDARQRAEQRRNEEERRRQEEEKQRK
jgi:hypothetical protein